MSRTSDRTYRRNRELLRRTSNLVCVLCGQPIDVTLPQYDPLAFWADHVIAVARGGDNGGELVPMHRVCNQRKGTKSLAATIGRRHSRAHY